MDDTQALRAHLRACGREAAKARRKEARNALNAASGYVGGNLRGVLSAAASQKQLATQNAKRAAQRQAHEKARAEQLRAQAQRRSARERSAEQQQPRPQPAARAPAQQASSAASRDLAAGETIVADYRNKIEKLENFVDSLYFLSRWEREIPQKVTPLAGKGETDKLLEMTEAKRKSIREYIVAAAKKSINEAEAKSDTDRHALDRIERTSMNIANAMLTREQVKNVQAYAREHQVALADRELATAEKTLGDYPETMKGLDKLQRDLHLARTGVLSRGSEAAIAPYLEAARARLAEVAEEALPEFKEALAGLPDSPIGLRATQMTVVKAKGFKEVAPAVRADYEAALQARREAIGKAIGVRVETARTEAVAAGGDPDLVSHLYVDAAKGWQLLFRDENQAVLASRRNRDTASYEVRGNEVVVKGPQI